MSSKLTNLERRCLPCTIFGRLIWCCGDLWWVYMWWRRSALLIIFVPIYIHHLFCGGFLNYESTRKRNYPSTDGLNLINTFLQITWWCYYLNPTFISNFSEGQKWLSFVPLSMRNYKMILLFHNQPQHMLNNIILC